MNKSVTPWNPSSEATDKVKNPLPPPTECPHCFDHSVGTPYKHIAIVNNEEIYGRSYGKWPWVYQCQQCGAYVGMHPFTNIPLGTLADGPTRQARKRCKEPFESLHTSGRMTRSEAYQRLADKMGIPVDQCHFAWFDIEQCHLAASAARTIFIESISTNH